MANTHTITDTADKKTTLTTWGECDREQAMVTHFTARLAEAEARLTACQAACEPVFAGIISRAGGSLGAEAVTGAATVGGNVEITTA